jgi:hypothetical protein
MTDERAQPQHQTGNETSPESAQSSWLAGLLGSDAAMLLYFLSLYALRKKVTGADYRELRSLWWGSVAPVLASCVLVAAAGSNSTTHNIVRLIGLAASGWLVVLMLGMKREGYLAQKVFRAKPANSVAPVLCGLLFLAIGGFLTVNPESDRGFGLIASTLAASLSMMLAAYLFKCAYWVAKGPR